MSKRNFLLFTNNFPFAKLEITFLGGEVISKISEHVFVASIPISVSKRQLSYSSPEKPLKFNLDERELQVLKTWRSWDQSFLSL